MKLAEILVENGNKNQTEKSSQLVRIRLKELVYAFPNDVLRVLHKTGISVSSLMPPSILHSIVIKNLDSNIELREDITKMLLELDGYASADGQILQIAGNVASGLGTILLGIGRSQTSQTQSISEAEKQQYEEQIESEKIKSTRRMWLAIGVGIVIITAVIIAFKMYGGKAKTSPLTQPKLQVS